MRNIMRSPPFTANIPQLSIVTNQESNAVTENKYEAPGAQLNPSKAELQAATALSARTGWFSARPIPVFIIASWCVLQFAGIVLFMSAHWHTVIQLVQTGTESSSSILGKLLYPLLLFAAGILLLFMRKAATIAFGVYFAWGCAKIVSENIAFSGYLSLALVLGIIVYCLRLQQSGRLK